MNPLICSLHELAGKSTKAAPIILSGLSLCRRCAHGVAKQLGYGGSVSEILAKAVQGELP